eukprot:12880-Heterococcus_DN1.PRE.1
MKRQQSHKQAWCYTVAYRSSACSKQLKYRAMRTCAHCCVAAQGLLGAATNIYPMSRQLASCCTTYAALTYLLTCVKLQYRCQCNSVSLCAATAATDRSAQTVHHKGSAPHCGHAIHREQQSRCINDCASANVLQKQLNSSCCKILGSTRTASSSCTSNIYC